MDKEKLLQLISKFKQFKRRSWNPNSARSNEYYFRLLTEYIEDSFDTETILDFFNYLQDAGLSENTRRQSEKAIMAFTKWLYNEGITPKNLAANIERTRVHKQSVLLPSQAEVIELIKQVTEPKPGDNILTRFSKSEHRACLLFIVTVCGGRNFETTKIMRKDVSLSGLQLELKKGKGGQRTQAIPNIPWIVEDLKRRVEGSRTKDELKVLNNRSHFKESDLERLFVVNMYKLQDYMREVGKILGINMKVHDLRRIFARDMKGNGAPIDDIRDVMGHRDINTTLGYLAFDTSTQARTLKNYSSEARRYRTAEEKAKEITALAWDLGKIIKGGNLKGNRLTLEVELFE